MTGCVLQNVWILILCPVIHRMSHCQAGDSKVIYISILTEILFWNASDTYIRPTIAENR